MRAGFLALALALASVPTRAVASDYWESLLAPGFPRYRAAVATGKAHLTRREWGLALVAFEEAVATRPDRAEAHRLRGEALARLRRWAPAVEAWARAEALDPLLRYDLAFTFDRGVASVHAGRLAEARVAFERLVGVAPPGHRLRRQAQAHVAVLVMASGPEELPEAIEAFRTALADAPDDVLALSGLALALDRAGSEQEASAHLDRLRAIDPSLEILATEGGVVAPTEEKHALRALRHEAAGNLVGAAAEWESFLSSGGGLGPWAAHGRRHLDSCLDRLSREPRGTR